MSRIPGWLSSVVALSLCAVAVALSVLILPLPGYRAPEPPTSQVVSVEVVERSTDLPVAATLQLGWSPSRVLRSGGEGLITDMFWEQGRPIRCGDRIMEVVGVGVVAYCGARPLWREVTPTTQGSDRDDVVAFLRDLGRFAGTSGSPTNARFRVEVRRWQDDRGLAVTGALRPQDLIWTAGPVMPSRALVSVGDRLELGQPVFEIAPTLTAAAVADLDPSPSGPREFVLDGDDRGVGVRSDGTVEDLTRLANRIVDLGLMGEDPPTTVTGTVRLRTPADFVTVPATSLVADSGAVCVIVVDDQDGGEKAVVVEPVLSLVGVVFVAGPLAGGMTVLVDPDRARGC